MRTRVVLLLLGLIAAGSVAAQPQADANGVQSAMDRLERLPPLAMDEVLWLARCLLSESDQPHEQRLVAWVVRNRVETGYRGTTYREVVLEPRQFSAFNANTERRRYLLSLNQDSHSLSWQRAVEIALEVYQAPASARPFALTVRHFYSPISMKGARMPLWAQQATPLPAEALGLDPQRFRFYDNIDASLDPPLIRHAAVSAPEPPSTDTVEPFPRRHRPTPRLSGRVPRPSRPTPPTLQRLSRNR